MTNQLLVEKRRKLVELEGQITAHRNEEEGWGLRARLLEDQCRAVERDIFILERNDSDTS